ncbi:MAG TPA: IclR family transcriptional regulator [Synergistaceae bacterium]|nr:IclR family transcriptional regulator [Synergistaceae bacterium]
MDGAVKTAAIMEALCASPAPLTVRDVEEQASIPRSTAHRFLLSLEETGWVFLDGTSGGYRPGIRFLLLSNRMDLYDELIRTADPEMRALMAETGNTAVLSVLEGSRGFCIHTVEPATPVKFTAHRGMAVPLHAGATGKILLAHAAPEVRERVLAAPLSAPLGGDAVDTRRLREELEDIRKAGYATSSEEWMPHAGDISVPVFDRKGVFVAQLGVAGIAESVFHDREGTVRLLTDAARRIQAQL